MPRQPGDLYLPIPGDRIGLTVFRTREEKQKHVPSNYEAVRRCMPALFDLPREEPELSVQFDFVHTHPSLDENGRLRRFRINVVLGAGDTPAWLFQVIKQTLVSYFYEI